MRPSVPTCPRAAVVAAALLLLLAGSEPALAKRFDCRMFCRSTGFRGMVGGCRCSFTLFTAKRSVRDQNSVPEPMDSVSDSSEGQYLSVADLVRLTQQDPATLDDDTLMAVDERDTVGAHQLPRNHPLRLLAGLNASTSSSQRHNSRLSRSVAQNLLKRKEFEQDLDNGDTSDYLRLPY